jgi:hypothetical protein
MRTFTLILFCFLFVNTNAQVIALNFAGDDDWVTGTNNSLPQGNAPRTIEAWIKYSTSKNDMSIFNYGTFSYNQKFTLHLYNGVYIIGEGNDLSTGYHFNDGNWHHLAVTHDGATTIVYVDGIVRGSRNTTYNTTGFDFQMGVSLRNGSWDFRFEGTMDELRVWNVARTQQEIADSRYNFISTAPGLIAAYHFNEGVPNANNTAISTILDATGNGNNGALNNFTLSGTSSNFVDDAVTLPLRLLSFTAGEANCTAYIKWQTAEESNVSHFIVEQSKNGNDFSLAKEITPQNTPGENSYSASIPLFTGKNYYRLKMVDRDGKFSYSNTVSLVTVRCNDGTRIWPNPVKDMLYVSVGTTGSEYRIYNSSGILLKKDIAMQAVHSIDVSKLPTGLYYITVDGKKHRVFIKE